MPKELEGGVGMQLNSGAEKRFDSVGCGADDDCCPVIAFSMVTFNSLYLASCSRELAQTAAGVRI